MIGIELASGADKSDGAGRHGDDVDARIIFRMGGIEGYDDGLWEAAIPRDWRVRPRQHLALLHRLRGRLRLHPRPLTLDAPFEPIPGPPNRTLIRPSGTPQDGPRFLWQRISTGTDYRQGFSLWARRPRDGAWIHVGTLELRVRRHLKRWYGPLVAAAATPLTVAADLVLLPVQPWMFEYLALQH